MKSSVQLKDITQKRIKGHNHRQDRTQKGHGMVRKMKGQKGIQMKGFNMDRNEQ